jgi:transcriptional regulator with XRE-family HTH domain
MTAQHPPGRDREIGDVLRDRRLERRLTQVELARRSGIAQGNISRYEAGLKTPEPPTIRKLAMALGLPATDLLLLAERAENREHAARSSAALDAALAIPAEAPRGRLIRLCARLTDEDAAFFADKVIGPAVAAYGAGADEAVG